MKKSIINKIIFYTILVICISYFSCFPKSYSKYIKDEVPLKYDIKIANLYSEKWYTTTILSTSTYKTVNYSISFDRSQVMNENDQQQQLTIEIEQSSCQIIDVISNGNFEKNGNQATITYNTPGTDKIGVHYKCNVLDIVKTEEEKQVIYTNVYVHEKFIPENVPYLYTYIAGTKKYLDDYYIDYPKPAAQINGKTLVLHEDTANKQEALTTWIKLYNQDLENDYGDELLAYVNSGYESEEDIKKLSLRGINVTYDDATGNYTYEIDDNFVGYARTYYLAKNSSQFIKMHFSNDNLSEEEANDILRHYFLEYSGYSEEKINKIVQYVSRYDGGINYILKPKSDGTYNEIKGFLNDDKSDGVRILDTLMQYVDSYIEQKIVIEYSTRAYMFTFYKNALTSTYDFITDELFTALTGNGNIFVSIGKNANDIVDEKVAYSDYFTIEYSDTNGAKKYVLLNIYSGENLANTCVEIIELGTAEALNVTKTETGFDVSITVDNQDLTLAKNNVLETVLALDTYLEVNYKDKFVDELFTSSQTTPDNITSVIDNENKTITISYSISK